MSAQVGIRFRMVFNTQATSSAIAAPLDFINEGTDAVGVNVGIDAVAQVSHVPAASKISQHLLGGGPDLGLSAIEHGLSLIHI